MTVPIASTVGSSRSSNKTCIKNLRIFYKVLEMPCLGMSELGNTKHRNRTLLLRHFFNVQDILVLWILLIEWMDK
jgi:hypothetical protein